MDQERHVGGMEIPELKRFREERVFVLETESDEIIIEDWRKG